MTIKELQKMIKEEFEAYQNEAEDEVDVSVSDADIDAEVGDEAGDEGAEDILRNIYDMLKAKFEAEEETPEDLEDVEDVEDVEEEADLEENSTTAAQYQKSGFAAGGKKSEGPNVGYGSVGGKGGTGFDAGSKALQERFQKLANIVKG